MAPSNENIPSIPMPFVSWLNQMLSSELAAQEKEEPVEEESISDADSDPEDLDALMARELNQMSMKEREAIYEEIHGVDTMVEETPGFVMERLVAMNEHLQNIADKPAYEQAEHMCKEYVNDQKFRLMFLRTDYFHAKKAAIRLIKFMEEKKRLFGAGTLGRELRLSDLSKDDMVCVKSGAIQALPTRDRAGRAVYGTFRNLIPRCYKEVDNMLRALAYIMMTSTDDEENQKRGLVSILYTTGPLSADYNRELLEGVARQQRCLPLRYNCIHVCFNDPLLRTLEPIVLLKMGRDARARIRMHYGTLTECQYSLMTFGIPVKSVPVSHEGQLKTTNHVKWLAKHEKKDVLMKQSGFFNGVDLPARNDVLLGRGKPYQEHPGNITLRSLVEISLEEYQKAPMGQKNAIAGRIVKAIQGSGGLFLKKRDDGWWDEAENNESVLKVLKTFRTIRANVTSLAGRGSRSVQMDNRKRVKIQQAQKMACPTFPCGANY